MDLTWIHGWLAGVAVVASWALVAIWGLVLRLAKAGATPLFWRAVSVAQLLLLAQLLLGLVLLGAWVFGTAGLPGAATAWDTVWHLLYGLVFPVVVLFVAHKWARDGRFNPHAAFSLAGLIIFGLTARAFMVGLLGA